MQTLAISKSTRPPLQKVVALDDWRKATLCCGYYKYRLYIDKRLDRWFVGHELPEAPIFREWLYFDQNGVPVMYFNVELAKLFLL